MASFQPTSTCDFRQLPAGEALLGRNVRYSSVKLPGGRQTVLQAALLKLVMRVVHGRGSDEERDIG